MAAPRLLVFDLDGTLIDSSIDLCNAVNAALEYSGRRPLPHAVIASYIGDGAATLVRRALACSNTSDEAAFQAIYEFFLNYYRVHKLDNTHCYEGVLESLAEIRAAHPLLPMAVLTNKPVNPSREICIALGLSPYFFQNYGGNSFATKKPNPEGLLTIIDEANSALLALDPAASALLPCDVVLIGDSAVDIETAKRCGVRSIGCAFGLAPAAMAAANPDAIVDRPSEWRAVLEL